MNKVLFSLSFMMFIVSAHAFELKVNCNNIIPKKIITENGTMLTDSFVLHERLGYLDQARTNYGLIQKVNIVNAKGIIQENLSVAHQFYPNGNCGPARIIADNKSEDRVGNDATIKITIEIQNTCKAKQTSRYTFERNGRQVVTKSFTECSYIKMD